MKSGKIGFLNYRAPMIVTEKKAEKLTQGAPRARGLKDFKIFNNLKDFENLKGFLRNVVECTKLRGYFICTCYNGNKVFTI